MRRRRQHRRLSKVGLRKQHVRRPHGRTPHLHSRRQGWMRLEHVVGTTAIVAHGAGRAGSLAVGRLLATAFGVATVGTSYVTNALGAIHGPQGHASRITNAGAFHLPHVPHALGFAARALVAAGAIRSASALGAAGAVVGGAGLIARTFLATAAVLGASALGAAGASGRRSDTSFNGRASGLRRADGLAGRGFRRARQARRWTSPRAALAGALRTDDPLHTFQTRQVRGGPRRVGGFKNRIDGLGNGNVARLRVRLRKHHIHQTDAEHRGGRRPKAGKSHYELLRERMARGAVRPGRPLRAG